MLEQEEKSLQASALFHFNEGTIIVELVSLHSKNHRSLLAFLESLGPKSTYWSIPREILGEYNERRWTEFRQRFAVMVNKEQLLVTMKGVAAAIQRPNVAVHVWGFDSTLEAAHTFLIKSKNATPVVAPPSAPVPTIQQVQSKVGISQPTPFAPSTYSPRMPVESGLTNLDASQGGLGTNSTSSQFDRKSMTNSPVISMKYQAPESNRGETFIRPAPIAVLPPQAASSSVGAQPQKNTLPFQGTFVFQDRDAGIFYQTFESEFRNYLSRSFDVQISELAGSNTDHNGTRSRQADNSSSPTSRSTSVKIEFVGTAISDISACRTYLEQLHSNALARHQIYFPNTDAAKYRELLQHKSKQDLALRQARNSSGGNIVDIFESTATSLAADVAGDAKTDSEDSPMTSSDGNTPVPEGVTAASQNNSKSAILIDPLDSDGYISIRLKPPLNSRGIK